MASTPDYQNPFALQGALQLWEDLLSGKSASTVDCYIRDVRQVAAVIGEKLGSQPKPEDIMALDEPDLTDLVARWSDDAPATVRRRLVSLRRFGRMLAASLGMTGPLLHCRFPVVEVPATEPVVSGDLDELVEATGEADDWVSRRDAAIITLASEHGLSTGELGSLDRSHLVTNLLVVTGPKGALRFIVLSAGATQGLETYRATWSHPPGTNGPLWLNRDGGRLSVRSIQQMMRRRRVASELPGNLVAGAFRKRRILALAASGMGIDGIAAEIGIGKAAVLAHLPGS